MEYFEKPICSDYHTREILAGLKVNVPDKEIYRNILRRWDGIAKPLDSMGRFERVTAKIGAILGTEEIDIGKKAVVIMCADNGIVEEGVSQSGQEVTAAVAAQMGKGSSSVGKMAAKIGADTIPIDIGINCEESIPGTFSHKICRGTRNFRKEPAMSHEEAIQAVLVGINIAASCKQRGYRLLATGEMGIGNTTTSSAVAAALLNCDPNEVIGRGAGLSDEGLCRKRRIIGEAIARYQLAGADPIRILESVGGLDIAGLSGICIGGALSHIPIVLDGVISMTAALLAERIVPGTVQYLVASHRGKEPAVEKLTRELRLEPVIDGEMALGEGTGAVMMMALLDMALCIYQEGNSFSEICVAPYERYAERKPILSEREDALEEASP